MSACLALERPITVAYLGPQGTFRESAAMKHFGHAAVTTPQATIDEVYRAVEWGAADFGVVPVENSTEGAVGRSLDLMPLTPAKVCGEVLIRIHHHLMCKDPATALASVRRIYSHSQSLAQCHEWLNAHVPVAERMAVASNPEAARRAAEEPGTAAVAGDRAASTTSSRSSPPTSRTSPTTRFCCRLSLF